MITTRPYRPGDGAAFEILYHDYLKHYQLGPPNGAETAQLIALLDDGRHMSCLMAHDGERPAGFATWALTFPAGRGTALFMKELFVDPQARGRGVGRHLMAGLVGIAEAEGCVRFDWQTDGDNADAQAFYKAVGAPQVEKRSYRVPAAALAAFRARLTRPFGRS
ncbi:MAG: GNAT family N-acetyltransferase [Roseovarius sp.]